MGQCFKDIFYVLENFELLDMDNPIDIWTLHQVFLLAINRVLDEFRILWNHHRSSSSSEKSPLRQYIDNLHRRPSRHTNPGLFDISDDFAIDTEIEPVELASQEIEDNPRNILLTIDGIGDLDELEYIADSGHEVL